MRVFFSNLGCKLNQAELEHLARRFVSAGHEIAPTLTEADLHVVNSCTVTHVAARDSRKLARRGRRLRPTLRTVLTGCYVDGSPREAAEVAGVDLVVPNREKERLLEIVDDTFPTLPSASRLVSSPPLPYLDIGFGNTRSLVKVEDGCNMPCAFCIIPTTRGRQRSRPLPDVRSEVATLVAEGIREVVLTGVQISSYSWRGADLFDLVVELLEATDIARLRLTSLSPWRFDSRLLDLANSGRLCRHFHLSLQSGCDRTLARMRRPYTVAHFARLLDDIRSRVDGAAITTDVIVGFPSETEAEFAQGYSWIESAGFARIHAFPFSSRAGTAAAAMPDQVDPQVRSERMGRLLALAVRAERSFARSLLGGQAQVLWESRRDDRWVGTTDNYVRVATSEPQQTNTLTRARFAALPAGDREVTVQPEPVEVWGSRAASGAGQASSRSGR